MKIKKTILFCILFAFFVPFFGSAQGVSDAFEAKVIEVMDQKEYENMSGQTIIQQNLLLEGLEGRWQGKQIPYYGISEFEVVKTNTYKKGDRVLVNQGIDADGEDVFFVLDYVRRNNLYWLAFLFALVIVAVGGWKGFKSIVSLIASFFIIVKFIIPQILAGQNPLLIGIIGSFFILLFIIYLTEGFNKKAHISIFSIFASLLITGGLAMLFSYLARLTGRAQEETMYLMGAGFKAIDFQGLLLAGILIGALGVLDDMVISQVEAVKQLKQSNSKIKRKDLIKKSLAIGRSHLGAIINTLFLAYVAVSLPFLILFSASSTMTFSQVINNELIATEIIRTLVGSIGIALALPIATFVAVYFYDKTKKKKKD